MARNLNKLLLVTLLLTAHHTWAQSLLLSGKIRFERKENVHKQFENESGAWVEEMIKRVPKYKTDYFELTFNREQSLYKLVQEEENQMMSWNNIAHNNTVHHHLVTGQSLSLKNVYDNSYAIKDTLPSFKWKLLGEYRNIAGFNCRKAATIIQDSIYIIAFYTDEIPVKTGPESFNGLPGMILGIVVPRLHMTLFATTIDRTPPAANEVQAPVLPKKTKPVTQKAFMQEITSALKDWGKWANKVYWKSAL
jgi:GLPGLI family protein